MARREVIFSASHTWRLSFGLRREGVERQPGQALELRPARVRLVECARERGALEGEEPARVEDVVAGRAADGELVAADAEVLLGLHHADARGFRRREPLLGALPRRPDRGLELPQLALERDPVPVARDP